MTATTNAAAAAIPSAAPQPDPDFLTVKEVATRLRQSEKTVRRRIADRKLGAIKDARVLIPISEYYAYLDKLRRRRIGNP